VPSAPRGGESSFRRDVALRGLAVVGVLLVLAVCWALSDVEYWGRPEQRVTITEAVEDGTLRVAKSVCDADRFTVVTADGRSGSFRACADDHAVRDELAVRFRTNTSDEAAAGVMTLPRALVLAVLGSVVIGLLSVPGLLLERRRRAETPTFRVRRP